MTRLGQSVPLQRISSLGGNGKSIALLVVLAHGFTHLIRTMQGGGIYVDRPITGHIATSAVARWYVSTNNSLVSEPSGQRS